MILYDSTLITPTTGLMIWTLVTFVIVLSSCKQVRVRADPADDRRPPQAIVADLDSAETARDGGAGDAGRVPPAAGRGAQGGGKIVEDARRVGDERAAAAVAELEAEKDRLMRQTQDEIPAETRQALNTIKTQVADLAVAATEKVVRARLDEAEQRRLIDEALADVDLSTLVPPEPAGGRLDGRPRRSGRPRLRQGPARARPARPAVCTRSTAT